MSEGTICEVCGGNGFVRMKHEIFADQWETDQCHACCSSGKVRI
jgi:DnaJ-class molecular chaperone